METQVRLCAGRRSYFIVTGKSKRLLEKHVRPAIETFLKERGLELSEEKTALTYIKHGFTFLGQTFRKHGNVLHITPSKEGVLALKWKVGTLIRTYVSAPMPALVKKLNETLRSFGNYHRHVVASETFAGIDRYVDEQLWRLLRRRHPRKSKTWLSQKYWTAPGHKGVFSATGKSQKGKRLYPVVRLSSLGIQRYIKVKADANPYVSEYGRYFWRRRHAKASRRLPALSAREYRAMTR